jgi:hypothetical protein
MNNLINLKKSIGKSKENVPLQGGFAQFNETNFIERHKNAGENVPVPFNSFKTAVSARRQIKRGKSIDTKEIFESKRKSVPVDQKTLSISASFSPRNTIGEMILENKLKITKDEQSFFNNKHVFSNTSRQPGGT